MRGEQSHSRLGPKPFSQGNRSPPGYNGNYDSGLERDEPVKKNGPPVHDPSVTESDADTEVNRYTSLFKILIILAYM